MKKINFNFAVSNFAVLLAAAFLSFSGIAAHVATAADNAWADYINSGKTFYVIFDAATFDDSGWQGAKDPMGTLKAGETYTVVYNPATTNWAVTGYNEGTGGSLSFGYKTTSPKDGKLNLWGRVYAFNASGEVVDSAYGLVGHLSKTAKPQSVYPIKELGSCKSEADCKSYCDNQNNISACVSYGEKNGLLTKEQAEQSKKFADVLKGEGPGQCNSKASCEAFCSDLKNIDSCLSFAEKHDLIPAGALKEAKQVAQALKSGATMPGGCKNKESCSNYCAVSTHAEECLGFAEKAGFVSAEEASLARKVLPLINSGESPGGCKTKAECQKYCDNDSNTTECLNFAEKAGLISPEDAAIAKKVGGKGPGGCRSKDTCDAFCNNLGNQEVCFQFAKEHDIIPSDKLKEIEDGMGRMRAGLKQSPKEVIQCLKDNFGENVIGQIESGKFMPGPEMGAKIKDCFEKNMGKMVEQLQGALNQAPPETVACLEKGLGESGELEKIKAGEAPKPEQGDVLRKCFENMRVEGMKKFQEGLGQMPEEARACIEEKLGKDKVSAIERGEDVEIGPEIGQVMQGCAGTIKESALKMMEDRLSGAPPEIRDCIKSKIGDVSKMTSAPSNIQEIIAGCMANFKPNIPASFKPENIPEGLKPGDIPNGEDFKIPSGNFGPSSGEGSAPSAGVAPAADCSLFASVPSCSYVPEAARDMCEKCKGD
ncbi:MAG: hypothetical protein HZC04_00915 [Candidatus Lloydbacteria bacterium]|nr:hypothetical protein [Candidatus Lloydbacteria bacterium]